MDDGGIDMDKKKKLRDNPFILIGMISLIMLATLLFVPHIPGQGWVNKKLTIEGVITKVEFIPGSIGVPRTVILTFENKEIRQFKNADKAIFKIGAKHIIYYIETNDYYRIIDIKIADN